MDNELMINGSSVTGCNGPGPRALWLLLALASSSLTLRLWAPDLGAAVRHRPPVYVHGRWDCY